MPREFIKNVIPKKNEVKPFSSYSTFILKTWKSKIELTTKIIGDLLKTAKEQNKRPEFIIDFARKKYRITCYIEKF